MLIDLIGQRNAAPKLTTPAPNADTLETIFSAALRAPDHAGLKPTRFTVIREQGLDALGELFVQAETEKHQQPLSDERVTKLLSMPKRAPLIVVVSACIQPHDKVPDIEQLLSAGCATQNMLLAIESLGYHAIWRTGELAYSDTVKNGLGLADNETLIGFIYIGTREGRAKTVQPVNVDDFVRHWPA